MRTNPRPGQLERHSRNTLYEQVADRIENLIHGGTLRPGARIPSVRRLSKQLSVSVTTVLEGYRLLEDKGFIEARPQSGYYVRVPLQSPPVPEKTTSCEQATDLEAGDLVLRILREANRPDIVPLGAAVPSAEFLPTARLNRILSQVVRRDPHGSQLYDEVTGLKSLRVQIARRALESGVTTNPDEIVTTAGTQEAIHLCLRAVTKPGDTVAVESPTYYGLLEALAGLHLKSIEIATDPNEGICLTDLDTALATKSVRACVLVPSFGNPLGHCMSDDNRRELLQVLRKHDVPLIEDDAYGDLTFNGVRPKAVKAFDEHGQVLMCSSFSKTLAPGYRIGWAMPGRYKTAVEKLKFSTSVATATPTQMAVAAYLESGGFDRYLRGLRRTYRDLVARMIGSVGEHFPAGTRVTRPQGGHVLWVEMPEGIDSIRLHEEALSEGVSIAPGPLFTATQRYTNCVRLNCAISWTPAVDAAIATVGHLAKIQLAKAQLS